MDMTTLLLWILGVPIVWCVGGVLLYWFVIRTAFLEQFTFEGIDEMDWRPRAGLAMLIMAMGPAIWVHAILNSKSEAGRHEPIRKNRQRLAE